MQSSKQVFGTFKDVAVDLGRVVAWHARVPDEDQDENVLNTHSLQQAEQFLA